MPAGSPERLPVIVATARIFAGHDQGEQFAAGLDLIIAGLAQALGS